MCVDGIIATPIQNQVTDSTKTNISMSVLMRVQHNTNPHLHPNPLVFLPSMLPIRIECDSLTLLNASYPCYLTAVDLENFESDEKKWRLNGSLHKFTCTWKQWQSSSLNTVAICLALLRLMVRRMWKHVVHCIIVVESLLAWNECIAVIE